MSATDQDIIVFRSTPPLPFSKNRCVESQRCLESVTNSTASFSEYNQNANSLLFKLNLGNKSDKGTPKALGELISKHG